MVLNDTTMMRLAFCENFIGYRLSFLLPKTPFPLYIFIAWELMQLLDLLLLGRVQFGSGGSSSNLIQSNMENTGKRIIETP